jgi:hypothetical protein
MPKPSHVTRLLDAIDRGRHRTSCQASRFADLSDRNRFLVGDHVQAFKISAV